jgi:hypothetical protein
MQVNVAAESPPSPQYWGNRTVAIDTFRNFVAHGAIKHTRCRDRPLLKLRE